MITLTTISQQIESKSNQARIKLSRNLQQASLLQEVMERLDDGILIISNDGELIHANGAAYDLCCQLNQDNLDSNFVPPVIWQFCQVVLNSYNSYSETKIILSDEIKLDKSKTLRIRARLVKLERFSTPCLLITIENQHESITNTAIAEIKKYSLTPREAEIWQLYRAKNSYKEIATQLYITINTVKKHMKNIHAKRQAFGSVSQ
jgi:DNA-binding CsgD family transcriptional regulator